MRIKSIVLEYHCDIAVLRLYVIYDLVADLQFAGRNILQSCYHTKGGRLTASGRSYEDDELLIRYLQVEIFNSLEAVGIYLADVF